MKYRTGFVSNSSSSSFVIEKQYLSPYQIELIKNYHQYVKQNPDILSRLEYCYFNEDYQDWDITETDDKLEFYTITDNFDMYQFLEKIVKIDVSKLKRGN